MKDYIIKSPRLLDWVTQACEEQNIKLSVQKKDDDSFVCNTTNLSPKQVLELGARVGELARLLTKEATLIKRVTDDGLCEIKEDIPLGKIYIVLPDTREVMKGRNTVKKIAWEREMIGTIDGGLLPTELLYIGEPIKDVAEGAEGKLIYCPSCGKENNGHAALGKKAHKPCPGDINICIYCANPSLYTKKLTLEVMTNAKVEGIADPSLKAHILQTILMCKDLIKKRKNDRYNNNSQT